MKLIALLVTSCLSTAVPLYKRGQRMSSNTGASRYKQCSPEILKGQKLGDMYLIGDPISMAPGVVVFSATTDKSEIVTVKCVEKYEYESPALIQASTGLSEVPESDQLRTKIQGSPDVNFLLSASNLHILPVLDYFFEQDHEFVVMDQVAGSLQSLQKSKRKFDVKQMFQQVATALVYMHSNGKYHPTFIPELILTKSLKNPFLVLSDFENIKNDKRADPYTSAYPPYVSPEVYFAMPGADWEKDDVYSLGILLVQMITGKAPWSEPSIDWSRIDVLVLKYRFGNTFTNILRKVLGPAENRPSAFDFRESIMALRSFY